MKYKRRTTGEEKVQKIAAGEEGHYRMEKVPLKQTDRHHKSPSGDLCIRDRLWGGGQHCHSHIYMSTTAVGVQSGHTWKTFILRP